MYLQSHRYELENATLNRKLEMQLKEHQDVVLDYKAKIDETKLEWKNEVVTLKEAHKFVIYSMYFWVICTTQPDLHT